MSEHGGKNLVFVDEDKVVIARFDLFGMEVERPPKRGLIPFRIFA